MRAVRHIFFSQWPVLLSMIMVALLVNVPLAINLVLHGTAQLIQERVSFRIVHNRSQVLHPHCLQRVQFRVIALDECVR